MNLKPLPHIKSNGTQSCCPFTGALIYDELSEDDDAAAISAIVDNSGDALGDGDLEGSANACEELVDGPSVDEEERPSDDRDNDLLHFTQLRRSSR